MSHLTFPQVEELSQLLREYQDLFSDVPRSCTAVHHDVLLSDGARPIKQSAYRMSPEKSRLMKEEVDFLLDNDLAEPSDSPWASPCILVPKAGGGQRLCTDYRKVNALTIPDSYPLPLIDTLIDSIGQSTYVTKLDLLKGYYQIPLTENAKRISASVTPQGLFQYKVLPFGMRNSPPTFQRLMDLVISGLDNVKVYLDDLIIFSNSWECHLRTIDLLFQRLQQFNLTVNLAKSEFGRAEVVYLGYVVGGGKVAPVLAKVEAILQMSPPTSRKEVQRFIGMIGYYRRFCPNFAHLAAPLTDLISTKKKFEWTDSCNTAFENLKALLLSAPVLRAPDFSKDFHLQVDASGTGVGSALLQQGEDGILHPVSFFSKKLKTHQKGYSTVELEALSLLLALDHFAVYLDNAQKIVAYSDHNPLQFVSRMKNKNQRLTRWCLALQPYNIEIKHIRGKDNIIADFLSRLYKE